MEWIGVLNRIEWHAEWNGILNDMESDWIKLSVEWTGMERII